MHNLAPIDHEQDFVSKAYVDKAIDDLDISEYAKAIEALQKWYDAVGSKFTKESDGSIKMTGDFFTTGENSAGGKGSEAFDLASVLDRIAALESNAAKNLVVDFSLLSSNIGDGKLQTVMNRIGFTMDVVNDLLDAKYNKVVGNGTYKEVWNYTAHETASYIEIYLKKGDGNLAGEWYNLHYLKTTKKWNITWGEI